MLAGRATAAGARVQQRTTVTGPVRDDRTGRIEGVTRQARRHDDDVPRAARRRRRRQQQPRSASRPGASGWTTAPWAWPSARTTRARASDDEWLESHLELWDGGKLLPGYGWVFGLGDGTVNVGLGILDSSPAFGKVDYKALLTRWLGAGSDRSTGSPSRPSRSAARRCRWRSTASRTTPTACCSSATPAAWSTRSTARASHTRWSPASSRPTSISQALRRPDRGRPREGAGRLPAAAARRSTAATTRSAGSS